MVFGLRMMKNAAHLPTKCALNYNTFASQSFDCLLLWFYAINSEHFTVNKSRCQAILHHLVQKHRQVTACLRLHWLNETAFVIAMEWRIFIFVLFHSWPYFIRVEAITLSTNLWFPAVVALHFSQCLALSCTVKFIPHKKRNFYFFRFSYKMQTSHPSLPPVPVQSDAVLSCSIPNSTDAWNPIW